MKRNEGEDFEAYKIRRSEDKQHIKNILSGTWVWHSKNTRKGDPKLNRGTYIKDES